MTDEVRIGFEPEVVSIPVAAILPMHHVPGAIKSSRKYRQIEASIRKIGVALPPVVARHRELKDTYLLLDGHLRIEVLKELGVDKVTCIVSTDDEPVTYNRQVNRLATIQEHRMILKLIEQGISEELIAETLNVNVANIRAKRNLLQGVCPEAAELLEDKHCAIDTIRSLRKMKPIRQVEAAELMIAMNNYTVPYAKALLASTTPDQLLETAAPKSSKAITPEQLAQLQREMDSLNRGIKSIEATYGSDHLYLVLAAGYVRSLLGNALTVRYLRRHHPEILEEFVRIAEATAISSEAAE